MRETGHPWNLRGEAFLKADIFGSGFVDKTAKFALRSGARWPFFPVFLPSHLFCLCQFSPEKTKGPGDELSHQALGSKV